MTSASTMTNARERALAEKREASRPKYYYGTRFSLSNGDCIYFKSLDEPTIYKSGLDKDVPLFEAKEIFNNPVSTLIADGGLVFIHVQRYELSKKDDITYTVHYRLSQRGDGEILSATTKPPPL